MPHGGLVAFEPLIGSGGRGEIFGTPVIPKRAAIQDKTRRVLNAQGVEQVSSSRVWLDPEYDVPAGSRVTLWLGRGNERTTRVIVAARHEHGRQLPAHIELSVE